MDFVFSPSATNAIRHPCAALLPPVNTLAPPDVYLGLSVTDGKKKGKDETLLQVNYVNATRPSAMRVKSGTFVARNAAKGRTSTYTHTHTHAHILTYTTHPSAHRLNLIRTK